MEIVWKNSDGRWYHASWIPMARRIIDKVQIYNINEVVDIDSYKHVNIKNMEKIYIYNIKCLIGTDDFYFKLDKPSNNTIQLEKEWICKTCVKLCKSRIVSFCNSYTTQIDKVQNGGDVWSV